MDEALGDKRISAVGEPYLRWGATPEEAGKHCSRKQSVPASP